LRTLPLGKVRLRDAKIRPRATREWAEAQYREHMENPKTILDDLKNYLKEQFGSIIVVTHPSGRTRIRKLRT